MIVNIVIYYDFVQIDTINFRFSDLHGDYLGLPYLFTFLAGWGDDCHMPKH